MRDLEYLLDDQGVFLLVKGYYHPPGYVRAYPVFWPSAAGPRIHPTLGSYCKETSDWDNERYFRQDPASRPQEEPRLIPTVSESRIRARYRPQEYQPRGLEGVWVTLYEALSAIAPGAVGVLGSCLVGLDRDGAGHLIKDVDLSVHGRAAREQVFAHIEELRRLTGATAISPEHVRYHAQKFGAPFAPDMNSWEPMLSRKWSALQLAPGLLATLRFAYAPGEEPADPLAAPIAKEGHMLRGVVVDDRDVDYMPRRFVVASAGGETDVSSFFWGHQSCVQLGDAVAVTGDLRADGSVTVTRLTHGIRLAD